MAQTVTEVLTAGTDSVNLIDGVKAGTWDVESMEQSEINEMVQRNVDHLEIVLAYTDPDVAGSDEDLSSYNDAISTGKTYIENNS